ncbi:MAG: amidohydrolase [Gammaproteobacteria bacterium]|nr:amidohydrolase [Gammaproteobacteria bacterium]
MDSIELRHELHRHPELSGQESGTAARIATFFAALRPDMVVTGLGGTGLAFGFGSDADGPTLLLRCELDALPIQETNQMAYRSATAGASHKCGHDGHMAILAQVGVELAKHRPTNGRVVLLYQPAEESGAGAAAVIADRDFERLRPDYVFGLHNLPGFPLGEVVLRAGTFACASRGMIVRLKGKTAHAAQPETGVSPASAMCRLVDEFNNLAERTGIGNELVLATVVGAHLGDNSFGIAPDTAAVYATLRSESDTTMQKVVSHCESLVAEVAAAQRLSAEVKYEEIFSATINAATAVDAIERSCHDLPHTRVEQPFRWSEDFGRFTRIAEGAFFGLGAGTGRPQLHNDDYDFPDELIETGSRVFLRIVDNYLQRA